MLEVMLPAIYSTTAAAPLLHAWLYKISRTPRARLAVGYRIVDANSVPRTEIRGLRPLGNALYLDRLLAGGIVGEAVPLANQRIAVEQYLPAGQAIDVVV
jgi:hypothetical protein